MLSNKYGSLNMEENTGGQSEEVVLEEEKENEDVNIQKANGKGILHEKKSLVFGGNENKVG